MAENSCILRETRPKYYGTLKEQSSDLRNCVKYTVQPGDTLFSIAVRHDINVNQLKRVNRLWSNDIIVSETILLPVMPPNLSTDSSKTSVVNPSLLNRQTNSIFDKTKTNLKGVSSSSDSDTVSLHELVHPKVATVSSRTPDPSMSSCLNPFVPSFNSRSLDGSKPDEILRL